MEEIFKQMSLFNFEIVKVTLLAKLLPESVNSLIAMRLPMDSGIKMGKWFKERSKYLREWRLPIELGTFPKIPVRKCPTIKYFY